MAGLTAAGQYDYSGYMPNRPSLIRRPMPEKGSPAVRVTQLPATCLQNAQLLLRSSLELTFNAEVFPLMFRPHI